MELLCKKPVFKGSRVSMEFDIVRYVLIFLTCFGHNCSALIGVCAFSQEHAWDSIQSTFKA
jgi:hypothetical protein